MATVAKTPRTSSYTLASAGSGPFLVGFRLFDDDALDVHVNGIRATNFSITTDLSIGYDDNATITFDAALDASDEIQIDGALVPGRDADYLSSDPGMARKLNAELARLWSSVSEISMKVGRTARSLSPLGAFVPVAGRVVVFTADSIEAGPTVDEVENAQAAADSANADALIAVGAAVSAAAAADQVQGVLDSFSYAYLGAKAAEPTLDNEGGPLVIGMLYFNTSVSEMRIYDGITPWISYTASETALAKGNNLSDLLNVVAARANLGLGTAATTPSTNYATAAQGALADLALSATELADFAAGGAGQPRVYGLAIDVSAVTVSAADTYTASEGLSPVSGTLSNYPPSVAAGYTYTNGRFSGTMRFKCSHRMSASGTATLWFYKNGSIAAGPWTNTTTTDVPRTVDVSVAVNDVFEWRHSAVTNASVLSEISVTASDSLIVVLPTLLGSEA